MTNEQGKKFPDGIDKINSGGTIYSVVAIHKYNMDCIIQKKKATKGTIDKMYLGNKREDYPEEKRE
jgi:hypothetical protein